MAMDYRIRSGDTMSGIAAKFNVSLAALETANPQIANPSTIQINELLNVPATAATHQPAQVPAHVVTYVVQAGDSMSAIATAHNLSLSALEAANPQVASPNSISPGEVLNISGGAMPTSSADTGGAADTGGVIAIGAVTYGQYNGGGEVSSWVSQACGIMGVPSANWVRGYEVLCARESSGNANAINTYDSNANGAIQSDGHPLNCSRGAAQCIPGTFASNHVARTSEDIYDPVANIAASMRYVRNRYGVSSDGANLASLVQQADPSRPPRGY
jgi:LysM repeat protein